MQFIEPESKKGKCPVCGKEVVIRSTRDSKPAYCSKTCSSQSRYATRYRGSMAGPADRPTLNSKTKL